MTPETNRNAGGRAAPVTIRSDTLEAVILPLGAALVGLRLAGSARNLVAGFADPADHATTRVFAGCVVGPVANRVRDGRVAIDGTDHRMPLNENGRHCLHSGPGGLHARDWTVLEQGKDQLRLECILADGEIGLPGRRRFTADYRVEGASLTLTLVAETDRATPVNLALHPYFNLDGQPDITGHSLQIAADSYLPTDAQTLPTGEVAEVAGTSFDYRTARRLARDPALDTNFCLARSPSETPRPAARLRGADGTTLALATTAPGLQVYAGAHLPADAPPMRDFPPLAPFAAIALEPQFWPDAPHHAHFPGILLRPDHSWRQTTVFHLSRP